MTTPPLAPVDPRGIVLGDEVYTRIGDAILKGTLPAGEHLRDHELARDLGVSRTPVREALQRLERVGLVEVEPNRYTRVSVPNAKDFADTHEFVVLTMGNVMRLAVVRCDDDTLATGLDLVDAMIAASDDDDHFRLMETSIEFFALMSDATDNDVLLTVLREAELAIRRNLAGWRPFTDCPVRRGEGYAAFRDAVASRDPDAAEQAVRALHGMA